MQATLDRLASSDRAPSQENATSSTVEMGCVIPAGNDSDSPLLTGLQGGLIPCLPISRVDDLPDEPGAFLVIDPISKKTSGGVAQSLWQLLSQQMDNRLLSEKSVVIFLTSPSENAFERLCHQVNSWASGSDVDWIFPITQTQGNRLNEQALIEKFQEELMTSVEIVEARISESEEKLLNDFRSGNRGLTELLSTLVREQQALSDKTDRILLSLLELTSANKEALGVVGDPVEALRRKLAGKEVAPGGERLEVVIKKELPPVQGWLTHAELAKMLSITSRRLSKARKDGALDGLFQIKRLTTTVYLYRQLSQG